MQSDAQLVEAARAADPDACATLYDRYADRVHTFCHGRLHDDEAAADALRETFLRAGRRLRQLDDPAAFGPLLFAAARTTVAERAHGRGRLHHRRSWGPVGGRAQPAGIAEGSAPTPDPTPASTLLAEAATDLPSRDQDLLALHLREGLDGDDLATAMGVDPADVDPMVEQMMERVSGSVGSLLVARVGRAACDELDHLLADWNGAFSLGVRSRVSRHIDGCDTCRRTRRTAIDWKSIAAAMPATPAPAAIRPAALRALADAIAAVADTTPAPDGAPSEPMSLAGRADPDQTVEATNDVEATEDVEAIEDVEDVEATEGRTSRVAGWAAGFLLATLVATAAFVAWPVVGGDGDPAPPSASTPATLPPTTLPTSTIPTPSTVPTAAPSEAVSPGASTPGPPIGALFFGSTAPIEFPAATTSTTYSFANVGDTVMSWTASTTPPFVLDATEGEVARGEAITITISLDPEAAAGDLDGTLVIGTDSGSFVIALRASQPG